MDVWDNATGKQALDLHTELMRIVRPMDGLAAGDYAKHAGTPYAMAYVAGAAHLPMEHDPKELPRAIAAQCRYILSNLTTWRGPKAQAIKNDLTALAEKASKL